MHNYENAMTMSELDKTSEFNATLCHEYGDLLLIYGDQGAAGRYWSKSVDKILNIEEKYAGSWKHLFILNGTELVQHIGNVRKCLSAAVAVLKIALYACADDLGRRRDFVILATHILTGLMNATLPHPVEPFGYFKYAPPCVYPGLNIFNDHLHCQPAAVLQLVLFACEELINYELALSVLPLSGFARYIAVEVLDSDVALGHIELLKARILMGFGLVGAAIEKMTAIGTGSALLPRYGEFVPPVPNTHLDKYDESDPILHYENWECIRSLSFLTMSEKITRVYGKKFTGRYDEHRAAFIVILVQKAQVFDPFTLSPFAIDLLSRITIPASEKYGSSKVDMLEYEAVLPHKKISYREYAYPRSRHEASADTVSEMVDNSDAVDADDDGSIEAAETTYDGSTEAVEVGCGWSGEVDEADNGGSSVAVEVGAGGSSVVSAADAPSTVSSAFLSTMITNPNKAGTTAGGRTKEEIQKIVYELSKNSAYFKRQQLDHQRVETSIKKLMDKRKRLSEHEIRTSKANVNARIAAIDASRDLTRTIVHIDMDAFYASVEELDRPDLKDKPMAVGGSVLTTANYVARKYGCRSAMAGYIAKKLCPELIMLPCNFEKYESYARKIREVFLIYDPHFTPASLDEAYLDVTQYVQEHGRSAEDVVAEMRAEIYKRTGLTASAGIAANKMLAKVPGIGSSSERVLRAFDVNVCGDIYDKLPELNLLFTPANFTTVLRAFLGIGSTDVENKHEPAKSKGCERTFSTSLKTPEAMEEKLRHICETLQRDLDSSEVKGRTLTLKVKRSDFSAFSRAKTISKPIHAADDLYKTAHELLINVVANNEATEVRLLGVSLSHLMPRNQPSPSKMFEHQRLQVEVDAVGCPVCEDPFTGTRAGFDRHVEDCLLIAEKENAKKGGGTSAGMVCPVCGEDLETFASSQEAISAHVEKCLEAASGDALQPSITSAFTPSKRRTASEDVMVSTEATRKKRRYTSPDMGSNCDDDAADEFFDAEADGSPGGVTRLTNLFVGVGEDPHSRQASDEPRRLKVDAQHWKASRPGATRANYNAADAGDSMDDSLSIDCPVCLKQIEGARTEDDVVLHVDACLRAISRDEDNGTGSRKVAKHAPKPSPKQAPKQAKPVLKTTPATPAAPARALSMNSGFKRGAGQSSLDEFLFSKRQEQGETGSGRSFQQGGGKIHGGVGVGAGANMGTDNISDPTCPVCSKVIISRGNPKRDIIVERHVEQCLGRSAAAAKRTAKRL
ncbi:hypothetical protein HK101_002058 [Irineochytrium annulatum]|nr:hypothetical protein HK101_002058 [Irineochytrium annulatum]